MTSPAPLQPTPVTWPQPSRRRAHADAARAMEMERAFVIAREVTRRPAQQVASDAATRDTDLQPDLEAMRRVLLSSRPRAQRLNRAVNIVIAVTALIVLAPLLLAIALLIKATSPGPVLYKQSRVGFDRRRHRVRALHDRRTWDVTGSVFTMYKFRSMVVDAEATSGEVWAVQNDPRVTPIGRVLRRFRLDELPQLINVIKGDMNIVGPRPERPTIIARLQVEIAEYPLRHLTRPGITGWAQINQCYDACTDDVRNKVRYDIDYLHRQCLAEDLRIMLRTAKTMFVRPTGW